MKIKKPLAIGAIFLFVGIAVAPLINCNVVKASQDDDFVEVTTQACGIQGYGDTTVKLTRQQYYDLEQYLVEFRTRLNQTTTREEAVPIFNDAVVELDKYGLLPKGMSIERAQRLVISSFQNQQELKVSSIFGAIQDNSLTNYFCFVSGKTTATCFCFLGTNLLSYSRYFAIKMPKLFSQLRVIFDFFNLKLLTLLFSIPKYLGNFLAELTWNLLRFDIEFFSNIFPYCLGFVTIGFNNIHRSEPANGWIQTVGLLGHKNINGSFYGQFKAKILQYVYGILDNKGIIGFHGFRFFLNRYSPTLEQFYLGTALAVKVGPEPLE